jgi:hypothetical protein
MPHSHTGGEALTLGYSSAGSDNVSGRMGGGKLYTAQSSASQGLVGASAGSGEGGGLGGGHAFHLESTKMRIAEYDRQQQRGGAGWGRESARA